jgi:hypothetical protein
MCVGISMCTNTQMFIFCTYTVDFNSFELLMHDLLAFKYQPIKIKHMCNVVFFFNIPSNRLIDCLRFYIPLKNISLIWRRHHCRWRAAKFTPMLGTQGLWAGRDLYRATPAVTRDLVFSGLIQRTAQFSRLLQNTRGCGGSILTRILTGPIDVYTNYLCYEYQLIWTLNEWFIGGLALANQIQTHMHARTGWHFSVYQSI